MARFENVAGTTINVDKIKAYYRMSTDRNVLVVELENREVYKAHDKHCCLEKRLDGSDFITQVIPCPKPLCARYREDDGKEYGYPVYYLGLCADGYVRPLDICGGDGICFADDASNYVGLYSESNEEIEQRQEERGTE